MRYPYLNFRILDNPYNCKLNILKYNMIVPCDFYLHSNNQTTLFKMFRNNHHITGNNIFNKIQALLSEHTINNQDVILDKNSIKIMYLPKAISLDEKEINNYCIIPNYTNPVLSIINKDSISDFDIHIPFTLDYKKLFINKPVWIDYKKIDSNN